MEETKVQIGDDVLLDIGTHSDWYISGVCYDGESVNVVLRRKADEECRWWLADTPQTDCNTCRHYKLVCELFSEVCKYEPTTQTETQKSNLSFENRTMLDCYNCKWYKSDDACVECRYEPIDTPQTESKNCLKGANDERSKSVLL